jgi:DNA polymerase I-like protein with 3'-5' exonuclease and polymerase domains
MTSSSSTGNMLFIHTEDDVSYTSFLKSLLPNIKCYTYSKEVLTFVDIKKYCEAKGIDKILSTSSSFLERFVPPKGAKKPSIDNYAGSYFLRDGIEIVFLHPLKHCVTVPYGKHLLERFVSKLTKPTTWMTVPDFSWNIIYPHEQDKYVKALEFLSTCELIGTDIETRSDPIAIRCVGYTGVKFNDSVIITRSYVLPFDEYIQVQRVREINLLPGGKVFQNGKYDISYFARYNCSPTNYLWDTANAMHSWYSELPKDLGFLQSYFVRTASYWKDLADSSDLKDLYLYNAKDTWATVLAMLAWIKESPEWAKKNYVMEFSLVPACHLSEMTGFARDMDKLAQQETKTKSEIDKESVSLGKMLGVSGFNTNSPKQMKALLITLGCKDIPNADEKALDKAAYRHPLNGAILGRIKTIRKARKLVSTYLTPGKEFQGTNTILYSLNPHGTDTGRLASKEHHFWTGLQVQNIPSRTKEVKSTIKAYDGFYFAECDLEQAESRDTAYITGDTALIDAVSGTRDFHSVNCAAFFGVPYEQIYDDETKKTINKALRDLAKRVNHGANYNMGKYVLVDTMGEKHIFEAARLLKLPISWDALDIAEYLLNKFAETYPVVRYDYQKWIVLTILKTRMLVGATGWTRYCFDDPSKSKRALNAYVAHNPQSLNAMVLNKAYHKVFQDIAIHPEHRNNFILNAQIHDSILFQYRIGHSYLGDMVKERMEVPVTLKDIKGIERTFTVPAALKMGIKGKPAIYWSDTE